MTKDRAIQEIRTRISCRDYLTKSRNGSYCCPFCGSGNGPKASGAVKVYDDTNTWACFAETTADGKPRTGDVIDLYQQITGKEFSAAIEDLAALAGVQIDPYISAPAGNTQNNAVKRPQSNFPGQGGTGMQKNKEMQQGAGKRPTGGTADYTAYYQSCNAYLIGPEGEAGRDYLNRRGVLSVALYYGVGYDPVADPANAPGAMGDTHRPHPCPRIIIPCSQGHYVARSIDPETPERYAKLNPARDKGAAAPAIFNEKALYTQEVQELFITEGAIDALSVMEVAGEDRAIGLNSASNAGALIKKLEESQTKAMLIICLDNDVRGKNAAQIVQDGLQRLHIPFITADITGDAKDPNEALQANYAAFADAVEGAIAEARAYKERLQQEAKREQEERQQRTGASMIDSFMQTVRTRKFEPVPTGITDIDRAIGGGFFRQQLILLGAAPGSGKTAFSQWLFEGMAKRGQSCLFVNLEMSREQLLARSLSRIAAQNGDRIRPTEILQGYNWEWTTEAAVTGAAEEYKRDIAPRMIYNPPEVTADLDGILCYIEEEAQRAEAAGMPAPCVVLDYLQIIAGRDREDEAAVIKRAMNKLKQFAIVHNTFVFAIMAINRASSTTGNVTMESGRGTSALEYGADVQLGLAFTYCLKKYGGLDKDDLTPEQMRAVTLKITKGRWGGPGADVNLYFDGETMTFAQTTPDFLEPAEEQKKAGRRAGRT